MGSEWQHKKIGEIGDVVTGKTPKTDNQNNFGFDIPFVTPRDLDGRRLIDSTERCLSLMGAESVKKNIIPENTIAVSCIGSDLGKAAIITKPSVTNQQINSVIPSEDYCYKFIYYNLSARKSELQGIAGGSAQPIINKTDFSNIEILCPPLHTQKNISSILECLDNKIELNRQLNQTLEHMAQALFKSWFVDFDPVIDNALAAGNAIPEELQDRAERRQRQLEKADHKPLPENIRNLFPSEFELTESLGWVPRGWEIKYLNDISRIVYGKNLPKTKILDEGYPVYGGNGIIGFFDRYLYDSPHVLVSCRGAASGKVHLSKPFIFVTNNSLVIEHEKSYLSPLYIYQALLEQDLTSLTTGSAQPQMTIENMNPVQLLVPSREIMAAHLNIAQSNHNKYLANIIINEELEKLRDTLLPKLISGELRIPEAQGLVEEVLG